MALGSIVRQDSQYTMWYSGSPNGERPRSGRATSKDGIVWLKDSLNPVLEIGSPIAWDDAASFVPTVNVDGSGYTMWYSGWTGQNYGSTQIGRATSIDGRAWEKDSLNPVLRFGAPGTWDESFIDPLTVVYDGTMYRMWYDGGSGGGFTVSATSAAIGYATSLDGIHWTKYANNPVLTPGPPGSWDEHGIGLGAVIYDEGLFHLWYTGNMLDVFNPGTSGIGYAISQDGIHWKKYPGNPVLLRGSSQSWDSQGPYAVTVLREGEEFRMWYAGNQGIGLATSPRSPATIALSSSVKDFQNVRPGTVSDTFSVSISNWGFTPLVISSVFQKHPEFALTDFPPLPVAISPFEEMHFGIVFRPLAADVVVQDTVLIASNDIQHPTTSVVLRGRGSGPIRTTLAGGMYGLAAASGGSGLYAIDKGTAAVSLIAELSPAPPPQLEAFTVRPSDRIMYAAHSIGNQTDLYRISSSFGDFDQVGSIPLGGITSMAFNPVDYLYLTDTLGRLYLTPGIGGDTVLVGHTGHVFTGLAFRPGTGTLWGTVGDSLFAVDPATAVSILRGVSQGGVLHSTIAFGPLGTLYGLHDENLVIIDPNDGSAVGIGPYFLPGMTLSLAINNDRTGEADPAAENFPKTYRLYQNYPNPFNPTSTIEFDLPAGGYVVLTVHDILGRLVQTLADGQLPPGRHTETINGSRLASGVYYYRIQSGSFTDTRKFVILH